LTTIIPPIGFLRSLPSPGPTKMPSFSSFKITLLASPPRRDLGGQKVMVGDLTIDHRPGRQPVVAHVLQDVPAPAARNS
jgi:hypothetical protein